jgi:hypothetical protein
MPALGHKRTFRSVIVMSALPPKADIPRREQHVRFVPIADIHTKRKTPDITVRGFFAPKQTSRASVLVEAIVDAEFDRLNPLIDVDRDHFGDVSGTVSEI